MTISHLLLNTTTTTHNRHPDTKGIADRTMLQQIQASFHEMPKVVTPQRHPHTDMNNHIGEEDEIINIDIFSRNSSTSTPPRIAVVMDRSMAVVTNKNTNHLQLLNLPPISPLARNTAGHCIGFGEIDLTSIDDAITIAEDDSSIDGGAIIVDDHMSMDTFTCNTNGSLSQTEKEYIHRRKNGTPYGMIVSKKVSWKHNNYGSNTINVTDDISSVLNIEQTMNLSDFAHLLPSNPERVEQTRTVSDLSQESIQYYYDENNNHHHDDGTINSVEFVLHILENSNDDDISCISDIDLIDEMNMVDVTCNESTMHQLPWFQENSPTMKMMIHESNNSNKNIHLFKFDDTIFHDD